MIIRKYKSTDCKYLAQLFYDTVHSVNSKDYSKEQLNAWATGNIDLKQWDESFKKNYTIVALENNIIVGFGDIDKTGYLDRLYVHKDYQGKKIATLILAELEKKVKPCKIITYASITAKPFFEKRGYAIVREQQVERRGILLTNYVMELRRKEAP